MRPARREQGAPSFMSEIIENAQCDLLFLPRRWRWSENEKQKMCNKSLK